MLKKSEINFGFVEYKYFLDNQACIFMIRLK